MAAKKKKVEAEDEAMKARKRAKMMKDEDGDDDDAEAMECSDAADDDEDDDKKSKRGKKMPWMKSKKTKKASDDDDEDMDEDDDEDEDDDMDKSERFSVDKLNKSLRYLEKFYEDNHKPSRKDALFAKAHAGDTLSKSEKRELMGLIDGHDGEDGDESLTKSTVNALQEKVGNTIEISDFLTANHEGMCESLSVLADAVEGIKKSQMEHNLLMAKCQVQVGELLKSLVEDRDEEMSQPARAPRARGVAAPLEKSFGRPQPEQQNYALVKSALSDMAEESFSKGNEGRSASGQDLSLAVTMFESSGQLPQALAGEVKEYIRNKRLAG